MAMMAANGPSSSSVVVVEETPAAPPVQTLRIKLRKPKKEKKVAWTPDTVDNENMNKKKSKCCCIYEKPREFDESSSDSEGDECDHCKGHVERKHRKKPSDETETEPNCPDGKGEEN